MKKAFLFITVHRRVFTLFAALFLSVAMMLMGEGRKTHFARAVTTAVFNTGRFTFSWGIYVLDLWRENKRLRLRNLELSDQIARHDTAVRENERLRRLLDLKQQSSLSDSVIVGTVLGHDFDRIVNSLIVDVGSQDGVKKNMAVVTAEGLVGKVYDVYPSSSSVQIIKDMNSKVSATAGGINGIIRWEGGPFLKMYGLPLTTIPLAGEKVYTTGFGLYPGGLYIGKVASRRFDEVERYASVDVETDVDFSAVLEVFIIRGSERSDVWKDGGDTGYFERPEIE